MNRKPLWPGGDCTSIVLKGPIVTFKQPDWYLNFSAQFMKTVLFEQKKIKL
jgi:hypothetical protein